MRLRSAEGKTHSGAGGGHRISEVGARWRQKWVGRGVARADSREGQRSFPKKKEKSPLEQAQATGVLIEDHAPRLRKLYVRERGEEQGS